jgi:hypothetical protein
MLGVSKSFALLASFWRDLVEFPYIGARNSEETEKLRLLERPKGGVDRCGVTRDGVLTQIWSEVK